MNETMFKNGSLPSASDLLGRDVPAACAIVHMERMGGCRMMWMKGPGHVRDRRCI
jgi:hypothetical protein